MARSTAAPLVITVLVTRTVNTFVLSYLQLVINVSYLLTLEVTMGGGMGGGGGGGGGGMGGGGMGGGGMGGGM